MSVDLSAAFGGELVTATLQRAGIQQIYKGKVEKAQPTESTIQIAVVPLSQGKKSQLNKEATRVADFVDVYASIRLNNTDKLVVGSKVYEVLSIEDWYDQAGYTTALCSVTNKIQEVA